MVKLFTTPNSKYAGLYIYSMDVVIIWEIFIVGLNGIPIQLKDWLRSKFDDSFGARANTPSSLSNDPKKNPVFTQFRAVN